MLNTPSTDLKHAQRVLPRHVTLCEVIIAPTAAVVIFSVLFQPVNDGLCLKWFPGHYVTIYTLGPRNKCVWVYYALPEYNPKPE